MYQIIEILDLYEQERSFDENKDHKSNNDSL